MKQRVLLTGKPGLDLLHRISSADISGMAIGQSQSGLILNPAGKILSLFRIKLISPDSAEIEFEPGFLALLEHYTFSERYTLEPLPPAGEDGTSEMERILSLTPKTGAEFLLDGGTNPLEVNLRSAIADQKGCYPGQEVIEKIISLGSPARKLCLIRKIAGDTEVKTPEPVFSETQQVGTLTSCAGEIGLALLRRTHTKPGTPLRIANTEWIIEKESP